MTYRKSHTRFRLVPKSTTLDDLEEPLCSTLRFKTRASFGAHHENFNDEDEDVSNDSAFWQYKVYADARGGSRDLCRFSLDLHMSAPISRYGMPYTPFTR